MRCHLGHVAGSVGMRPRFDRIPRTAQRKRAEQCQDQAEPSPNQNGMPPLDTVSSS